MSDNDNKSFSVDKPPAQFQSHHKAPVALARKENNPASRDTDQYKMWVL